METVKEDSRLPCDCGLVAAAAWHYLRDRGVPAHVLNVRYGTSDGHSIVVYESDGRLCTYDADGSMTFDESVTWGTPPVLLARAWAKCLGVKKRVVAGKWHSPAQGRRQKR